MPGRDPRCHVNYPNYYGRISPHDNPTRITTLETTRLGRGIFAALIYHADIDYETQITKRDIP